ncbi:MAG: hypothetical protein WC003_16485 [Terrimicrobiaceae bacterium]
MEQLEEARKNLRNGISTVFHSEFKKWKPENSVFQHRFQRQSEKERGTESGAGFHAKGTAHQFNQPFRNSKPESQAPVFVTGGKGVENRIQHFHRDSRSGILHAKEDGRLTGNRDGDMPLFRELDRVAGEVEQHLSQPPRVSDKRFGNIRGDVCFKGNALLSGLEGKQLANFIDNGTDGERTGFDFETARFHAGQIRNVFQKTEHFLGTGEDYPGAVLFRIAHGGFGKQSRKSHNAIQGSANFMADHCQKFGISSIEFIHKRSFSKMAWHLRATVPF